MDSATEVVLREMLVDTLGGNLTAVMQHVNGAFGLGPSAVSEASRRIAKEMEIRG